DMLFAMEHEAMEVRRFPLIDVQVNGNTSFHCLNEVSVRSTIIKSIVIDVFIDDKHFEAFRGDGLVVATPTGSTGYSKSTHGAVDRKSTRLNSSHVSISYAVFCLKNKIHTKLEVEHVFLRML